MEKKWQELSWQEKREERFKRWLSPEVKFKSPQAEKAYKERVTRFIKAFSRLFMPRLISRRSCTIMMH
jgi:hypothetical protein